MDVVLTRTLPLKNLALERIGDQPVEVRQLDVADVAYAGAETLEWLREQSPKRVAIVGGVRRSLLTSLRDEDFEVDLVIRNFGKRGGPKFAEWLKNAEAEPTIDPSVTALAAEKDHENFVIAPHALDSIDEVPSHRVEFIERGVAALCEIADGGLHEHPARFFERRGLIFASTGQEQFKVTLLQDGDVVTTEFTYWHLKKGDSTTRRAAARIYFLLWADFVILLYAGPHPESGRSVTVHL